MTAKHEITRKFALACAVATKRDKGRLLDAVQDLPLWDAARIGPVQGACVGNVQRGRDLGHAQDYALFDLFAGQWCTRSPCHICLPNKPFRAVFLSSRCYDSRQMMACRALVTLTHSDEHRDRGGHERFG